ncbi:hypothetical protein B0H14DRAFT_2980175 [Mycena olivaceomarginata]|nr:hypothetical protein B0H14DRAFT_2980175 [Mycena olivaceomarginata]
MSVNANLRARLAQVDASILELKLRLKSLEDNKQSIQDQLDGVIYPILTLPREITSEIFFHCLPPFPVRNRMKGAPNSAEAPLLLLRVCRTWSDIAVSTPRLWVCLHLDLRFRDVGELVEKKIEDWFLRAGACALSFSVQGHPYDDRHFEVAAIRATLLRFAPQLQTVSLWLQTHQFHRLVDIGTFPVLESLAVGSEAPFGENLQILGAVPRLRNLDCSGDVKPSAFSHAYKGLSTLTCQSLPSDDILDVMLCAPSLENFEVVVEDNVVIRHTDVVTHGHLQSLAVLNNTSIHFLRFLRLPALRELYLEARLDNDESGDFRGFLTRSSGSLRQFTACIPMLAMGTEWFSTCMPHLTDIELQEPPDEFLLDLSKTFLPHLRSLILRDCVLDMPLLFQALSSRCMAEEGFPILASFRVWPKFSLEESHLESHLTNVLRALIERGMSIYVRNTRLS